jgi:hypothetical protein
MDAKKAMEKAQAEYEEAKEAFTEEWKDKNPNGSEADLLEYLTNEKVLLKYSAALASSTEIYKKLLNLSINSSFTSIPMAEPHEFKLPVKRARSYSSITSLESNDSELSQDSFRKRIWARDVNGCVLTGKSRINCYACHIVPWIYFQKYDSFGNLEYNVSIQLL